MTPSHTNKRGLRYRYYVSQAVLQNRKEAAGTVTRVAAPDLEEAVIAAPRSHLEPQPERSDRKLVETHVRSVTIGNGSLKIEVYERDISGGDVTDLEFAPNTDQEPDEERPIQTLSIDWQPPQHRRIKGQQSIDQSGLPDAARGQLLLAIAKARRWMSDITGDVRSFTDIAREEEVGERHIRFLAPLAYVSPTIVKAIVDGRTPGDMTITSLVRSLPFEWAAQEASILHQD